jgi:hypothetical protein
MSLCNWRHIPPRLSCLMSWGSWTPPTPTWLDLNSDPPKLCLLSGGVFCHTYPRVLWKAYAYTTHRSTVFISPSPTRTLIKNAYFHELTCYPLKKQRKQI